METSQEYSGVFTVFTGEFPMQVDNDNKHTAKAT